MFRRPKAPIPNNDNNFASINGLTMPIPTEVLQGPFYKLGDVLHANDFPPWAHKFVQNSYKVARTASNVEHFRSRIEMWE